MNSKDFNDEMDVKFMGLDKKVLVKTLLDLSKKHPDIVLTIERLTSNKNVNIRRFLSGLNTYKTDGKFLRWNEARSFAEELEDILCDLEEGASGPKEGIELLKLFFEADQEIVHRCDDSSGYIGDVFKGRATDLFVAYAGQCDDKEWLANILWSLIIHNDYGLRDDLTNKVGSFLPEKQIRDLVERLWELQKKNNGHNRIISSEVILLQDMARGLKDPILFEKIIWEEGSSNEDYNNGRIGEMYFECGDFKKAVLFLEKVAKSSSNYWKVDDLLLQAYAKVGDVGKQRNMAWEIFRGHRTKENFETVIGIEGSQKREALLRQEIDTIFLDKDLKNQNVDFLLEMELLNDAESYIISRKNGLNGKCYGSLVGWAELFDQHNRVLVSSLIYRALLDSILGEANSKAYHYAVEYLVQLDKHAGLIQDWMGIETHASYFERLKNDHKRKHSFWSKYKGVR